MEEPSAEDAEEAGEFFVALYKKLTEDEKAAEEEETAVEKLAEDEKPVCNGKYTVKETASGFSFALLAGNSQVIGTSEVYSGKAAMEKGIESVRKNAPIANIDDLTAEERAEVVNPKFEIYLDKAGEYRFRLKARNGEVILASEGYKAKASCEKGIESVRKNAPAEIAE